MVAGMENVRRESLGAYDGIETAPRARAEGSSAMSTDLRVVSVVATIWSALDSPYESAGLAVLPAQIQQR
jgi:hypothetical protein